MQFTDGWWTWESMARIRDVLREATVSRYPGESLAIGVVLRNRPQHVGALLSVLGDNHCVVTLSAFQPDAMLGSDLTEMRLPVVMADESDWNRPGMRDAAAAAGSVAIALRGDRAEPARLLAPGGTAPARDYRRAVPGVAVEMLTSGTTGRPKRVHLRAHSLELGILSDAAKGTKPTRSTAATPAVSILWNPLVHIAGTWGTISTVVFGMRLSLLERFDIPTLLARIREHRPAVISLVPSAMRMLLDANVDPHELSSVAFVRSGTARVAPELIDEFEARFGKPVIVTYGATEFAGAVTTWTQDEWRVHKHAKRGSSGRVNAGFEIRIVDPDTFAVLPPDAEGLLEVRAEQVLGPEWIRTTDLARIDGDGFLYVTGRADRAINRGGFKVLPDVVVDALERHPAVREACVVAMPDARLGAVPVAAVEVDARAPGPVPTPEDLEAFVRRILLPYQVPVRIRVVESLPRTPSMKASQPDVLRLFQDGGAER
ncbi:MAG: class I adenylate-forming enzyme family protein [Gammaproteobacteria bacterium]